MKIDRHLAKTFTDLFATLDLNALVYPFAPEHSGEYYFLTRGRYLGDNSYDLYLQEYSLVEGKLVRGYENHLYTSTKGEMDSYLRGFAQGYKANKRSDLVELDYSVLDFNYDRYS